MREKEMEDRLEKELHKVEAGLTLVKRQKRMGIGVVDLFCKDKKGNYVIVEIKRDPSERVITQLAKYNMILINSGFNKKKLRTILVAPKFSKAVEETCKFFNFEIKSVYEEAVVKKIEEQDEKIGIPTGDELIGFIKIRDLVNFSMIAKHFGIKNATVGDLVIPLQKKKFIEVKKLGGSKVVRLKKSKR